MDFNYTEEQQLLADSVDRFVADNYELEARMALVEKEPGYSEAHWSQMAELGWLALPFAEEDGGFGAGPIEALVVMESFGRGLVVEPYFAHAVLGGGAVKRGGAELRKQLVPGMIDGSTRVSLAVVEEQARYDLNDVTTHARPEGDGWVINGNKSMVLNAASATHLVVSTRTSGGQFDTAGITLFVVPSDAEGIERQDFPTVDGGRASEIQFTNVAVTAANVVGAVDGGYEIVEAVAVDAALALCAEAVGCMEILYKDTIEYTQQREQFDHPLSDFQVLQHRMVEMFMAYEQAKSLLYRATMEVAEGLDGAQRSVHALKHLIGESGIFVGENAVQLHGGMGMTEELRLGHYFKRLLAIDALFGNADYHLTRFVELDAVA